MSANPWRSRPSAVPFLPTASSTARFKLPPPLTPYPTPPPNFIPSNDNPSFLRRIVYIQAPKRYWIVESSFLPSRNAWYAIEDWKRNQTVAYRHKWQSHRKNKPGRLSAILAPAHGFEPTLPDPNIIDYAALSDLGEAAVRDVCVDSKHIFWTTFTDRLVSIRDLLDRDSLISLVKIFKKADLKMNHMFVMFCRELTDELLKCNSVGSSVSASAMIKKSGNTRRRTNLPFSSFGCIDVNLMAAETTSEPAVGKSNIQFIPNINMNNDNNIMSNLNISMEELCIISDTYISMKYDNRTLYEAIANIVVFKLFSIFDTPQPTGPESTMNIIGDDTAEVSTTMRFLSIILRNFCNLRHCFHHLYASVLRLLSDQDHIKLVGVNNIPDMLFYVYFFMPISKQKGFTTDEEFRGLLSNVQDYVVRNVDEPDVVGDSSGWGGRGGGDLATFRAGEYRSVGGARDIGIVDDLSCKQPPTNLRNLAACFGIISRLCQEIRIECVVGDALIEKMLKAVEQGATDVADKVSKGLPNATGRDFSTLRAPAPATTQNKADYSNVLETSAESSPIAANERPSRKGGGNSRGELMKGFERNVVRVPSALSAKLGALSTQITGNTHLHRKMMRMAKKSAVYFDPSQREAGPPKQKRVGGVHVQAEAPEDSVDRAGEYTDGEAIVTIDMSNDISKNLRKNLRCTYIQTHNPIWIARRHIIVNSLADVIGSILEYYRASASIMVCDASKDSDRPGERVNPKESAMPPKKEKTRGHVNTCTSLYDTDVIRVSEKVRIVMSACLNGIRNLGYGGLNGVSLVNSLEAIVLLHKHYPASLEMEDSGYNKASIYLLLNEIVKKFVVMRPEELYRIQVLYDRHRDLLKNPFLLHCLKTFPEELRSQENVDKLANLF